MRIVISSGHGKHVRGAEGYLDEVDEARKVVNRVVEILEENDVDVTPYHDDVSDDQNENLNRIVDFHNSRSRDLDVSVHFNANNTTSSPVGTECWYTTQRELSADVATAIAKASGLKDRGPKETDNLFFLNKTEEPAILIEVCFVDSSADAEIYRQKFERICEGIAGALVGEEVEVPEPGPVPDDEHPMLRKGSEGPAVVTLQKMLGVLDPDGDFGSITETWVKAFQSASGLDSDGIVGDQTWSHLDLLDERMRNGKDPLPDDVADEIYTMAQTSEIADFSWPDRGIPPPGYIAGMALSFAYAVITHDDATVVMSQGIGSPDKDALAWYGDEFDKLGMDNRREDDRLRHLFVMMIGLGPRESSGKYCEGRDLSASNVEAETAEAGMFQTSWNIKNGCSAIGPLLPEFWDNPNGFLAQFKEGISPTANNLNSYGGGDGAKYQFLSRFCPLFHVMVTACGLRTLRQHWGPINRKEVTIKREADELLKEVQALVESIS